MKHKIRLTIIILLFWQLIAIGVNKDVVVPFPKDVMIEMCSLLTSLFFYQTIFMTLSHVVIVVFISQFLAFALAYLSYQKPVIDEYITPILSFLQSIPNISFIILVLVWASSLQTVYIVIFLVIFPLLYNNFIQGFNGIHDDLKDMIILDNPSHFDRLFKIYLPLIKTHYFSGLINSMNLGVKVAVMAEILAGLPYGVGRAIQYHRIQFDMCGVFAWTIWLVLLIQLFDYLIKKFYRNN